MSKALDSLRETCFQISRASCSEAVLHACARFLDLRQCIMAWRTLWIAFGNAALPVLLEGSEALIQSSGQS